MKMVGVMCRNCGKAFLRRETQVLWNRAKGMTNAFCSRACWRTSLNLLRRGVNNPHWKGGRWVRKDGYVEIRIDGRYHLEHVYIMEQHLKRPMQRKEIVHHLNGNRADNRLSNLEVMTLSEHMRHHHPNGIIRKTRRVQCRICHKWFQTTGSQSVHRSVCPRKPCKRAQMIMYCREHRARRAAKLKLLTL